MVGPKYPDVLVPLIGQHGDVFAAIGRVRQALRHHGVPEDEIKQFVDEVTAAKSYDDALAVVLQWVAVE